MQNLPTPLQKITHKKKSQITLKTINSSSSLHIENPQPILQAMALLIQYLP